MIRNMMVMLTVLTLAACGCQKPADTGTAPKSVDKSSSTTPKEPAPAPAPPTVKAPVVDKTAALPEGKPVADLKAAVEVAAATGAVKADGKLDEAVWKTATAMTGFVGESGKAAAAQTRVLVAGDKDNLYLAIVCDEPKTADLVGATKERDGQVWNDDCVEVYVDSDNSKSGEYYGFFVTCKNVVYDRQKVEAWDGKWESGTSVVDGKAWVAELVIPLKTMGVTYKPGYKLGLMVARNRCTANKGGEYTTLVKCNDSKDTDTYPTLVLK